MRGRRIGFAVWLLLAACLYFFENNTGTRMILAGSLLVPLLPALRTAFFSADGKEEEAAPGRLTVRSFVLRETDEPGDVRAFRPGDPVRRIHWKLSAKRGELLVREAETAPEIAEEERTAELPGAERKRKTRKRLAEGLAGVLLLCLALLLLVPEANRGAQALGNRLFAASEAVNAYAYARFPVPESQGVLPAALLFALFVLALAALVVLLRSRLLTLSVMAACTLFQIYFGLPFPAPVNVPLYGLLAVWTARRPFRRGDLRACALAFVLVCLAVGMLFPGADAATEAASEAVRDRLSELAQQVTGAGAQLPEGETETRHARTLRREAGEREARPGREYRLVTREEEQISMPRWVNWVKVTLLLLVTVALVILPFAPFLLLNARERRAREIRRAFASEDAKEAVRAIFGQVIARLERAGGGAENRLYRNWGDALPDGLPEGYAARFLRCAEDFEEAAYSRHALPEETRQRALDLLKETEAALSGKPEGKWRRRIKVG